MIKMTTEYRAEKVNVPLSRSSSIILLAHE